LDEPIRELLDIRAEMLGVENRFRDQIEALPQVNRQGARNLLHYLALRRRDIRPLQERLAFLGLSSLGRSESRALANLNAVLRAAGDLTRRHLTDFAEDDFTLGKLDLDQHTTALLGPKPSSRDVRIMVTMPSEAANDDRLVSDLVGSGMDCMRINCAHDDQRAWSAMVGHLRRAQAEHGKSCCVIMDLPGPKLRTGPIETVPGVIKWKPRRDRYGRVTALARIWLTPMEPPESPRERVDACLPVPANWLAQLRSGDTIKFADARGVSRAMTATQSMGGSFLAESFQTSYVTSETILRNSRLRDVGRIGALPPVAPPIVLKPGDFLVLTKTLDPGRPAVRSESGVVLEPARIGVTLPEIFFDVRTGEKIWFDDGKIGGIIRSVDPDEMRVEIVKARTKGENLRADKGINLPDSELKLPALTAEDIAQLPFIARHADLVGYSFVRTPTDIERLQDELARVHGNHLGIVLKIETRKAFERLPELILTAMNSPSIGVMIARGDLAVECGYERTGELQEEIMWIAEAAHVPVIWATQVLETLAKKGHPSRAEITDAAMAERAECVMLNKGPYVVDAVRMLDDVLRRMQDHQAKKAALLRPLSLAERFYNGNQSKILETEIHRIMPPGED
jgi:pyruvate kinase